jgi:hypothetical protein
LVFVALAYASDAVTSAEEVAPLRVVVIRHAEKLEKPQRGDNLTCQGENRARALPAVLLENFGKPDYTYVPALKLGESSTHARMFQTVIPLAIKENLVINSKYAEEDVVGVAKDVLQRHGLVLLVWESSQIQSLARELGVKDPPEWGDHDYDSIWVIRPSAAGASLSVEHERIQPDTNCGY